MDQDPALPQFEGLDLHLDGLLSTQKNQLLVDNFSTTSTNISKPNVIIGTNHLWLTLDQLIIHSSTPNSKLKISVCVKGAVCL